MKALNVKGTPIVIQTGPDRWEFTVKLDDGTVKTLYFDNAGIEDMMDQVKKIIEKESLH